MPTPAIQVALLRGINVGRAKRVAMADLRRVMEDLGYTAVRTVLNSGNVIFAAPPRLRGDHAVRIGKAVLTLGVTSRVIVIRASEIAAAVASNPLAAMADNPSRLMVLVLADGALATRLRPLVKQSWAAEALAVNGRFAYLWCPDGIIDSPLAVAVGRVVGDGGTMRNSTTMRRLHDAVTACAKEQETA